MLPVDLFHWLHEVGQTRGKEVEMCCEGTWKFAQHGDDVWQKDKWLRSEKRPKIWIWSIPGSKLWVSVGATRHINILIYSDSPRPKCIKILETLWMFSPNPVHRYCWFVSHHSGVQRWQVPQSEVAPLRFFMKTFWPFCETMDETSSSSSNVFMTELISSYQRKKRVKTGRCGLSPNFGKIWLLQT